MRAIYFEKFNGPVIIKDLPIPAPSPQGCVIKVEATGICRSDWHGYVGHDSDIKLPHVPGHEFAGTIFAVGGGVKNFKLNQRVTVPFVNGCSSCQYCISGNAQVCPQQTQAGFTHFGSFAEYVKIENADFNLVNLPDQIDFNSAAALGCRFATSYRGLIDRAKLKSGDTVAIYGCGGIGLSALIIAKAMGAKVICVDINERILEKAKALNADYLINSKKVEPIDQIHQITQGNGVDISIDALGSEQTSNQSVLSLKRGGKHLQLGLLLTPSSNTPMPMARVIAYELDILGSHGMSAVDYPKLLSFCLDKKIDLNSLIADCFPLEDGPELLKNLDKTAIAGVNILNPSKAFI